jgi:prepilin-type N-terminal cleavage/methylation domain-containing protein
MMRKFGNRKGLTLPEMLMATLLLGIGLTGVGGMFTAGVISNQKAANITAAVHRASQEVERIRDAGFFGGTIDAVNFPSPEYDIISGTRVGFPVDNLNDGYGYIDLDLDSEAKLIDPSTGLTINNLKTLQVSISWGGGRTVRGSYSITTLIANRP